MVKCLPWGKVVAQLFELQAELAAFFHGMHFLLWRVTYRKVMTVQTGAFGRHIHEQSKAAISRETTTVLVTNDEIRAFK